MNEIKNSKIPPVCERVVGRCGHSGSSLAPNNDTNSRKFHAHYLLRVLILLVCIRIEFVVVFHVRSNSMCIRFMHVRLPATAHTKNTVYIKLAIVCLCCFKIENNMTIDRAQIVAQNASGNHFINLFMHALNICSPKCMRGVRLSVSLNFKK